MRIFGLLKHTVYINRKEVIHMAKVPGVPTREFRAALKANNFRLQRSNGGHEIWEKTITIHCSFPNHGKEINGALAQRLNKELGLNMERFRK